MKALLLPSIKSVDMIYKEKKYSKYLFCTNSSSVKIYCEFKLNISCLDINKYFSTARRAFFYNKLLSKYLKDLRNFDQSLSKLLNNKEKIYVSNWIFHLYRYTPFFYYYSLFNFKNSLKNFLKKKD